MPEKLCRSFRMYVFFYADAIGWVTAGTLKVGNELGDLVASMGAAISGAWSDEVEQSLAGTPSEYYVRKSLCISFLTK